jgi:hypothetical protein
VTFTGLFACLSLRGARGFEPFSWHHAALATLATAAVAAPYFMLVQAVYIHDGYASAAFLFLFVACFWLADREQETRWLPFAFAFLFAFSTQRTETVLPALIFLGIACTQTTLPWRALTPWLVAYVVVMEAWYLELGRAVHDHWDLLTPGRTMLLMAALALLVPILAVARSERLAGLRPRWPGLAVALASIALVATFAIKPGPMLESGSVLVSHLVSGPWAGT